MSGADGWDADLLREGLVARGFTDDGVRLRGPVPWRGAGGAEARARVEIEVDERFPFYPPQVRLLDPGSQLEVTFHVDRAARPGVSGNLCLWDDAWPADRAPWTDPDELLSRIAGWLEQTAVGWPGDNVCDLERYLEADPTTFVLYDAESLARLEGHAVRTRRGSTSGTVEIRNTPHRLKKRAGRPGFSRADRQLVWVEDLGQIHRPVRSWADIHDVLGERAASVEQLVAAGVVNLVLLRYQRGDQQSVLALTVKYAADEIKVRACESADTSSFTRQLRAGTMAPQLADVPIAIVGCGAIGSFTAALLFRAGARRLTLIDHERLRPGNVVRHLAGLEQVGAWKSEAVRNCLTAIDPAIDAVRSVTTAMTSADEAKLLVQHHRIVVDATGSARATSMLAFAANTTDAEADKAVVTVCAQRDGDVVRVDRLPARGVETFLPPLPALDDQNELRENGCGSPVSRTPPTAVVAAAELACCVVLDELAGHCELPTSVAFVSRPQPEQQYTHIGLVLPGPMPQDQVVK
ncbi:ThiF family adenylyltransferase [Streptomyces sp. NPDC101219]|uniref:ThiF family adenylyltransferase n=1 Tax=Streptomyces sp. NPDC101219 TaxID=3366131 RepID=UPI0038027DA9